MAVPEHGSPGCTCDAGGEQPGCPFHGYEAVIKRQRAEVERLRDALDMAVYHAENLRRYIDLKPVRDLAESEAGFKKARATLRGPDA